MSQAGKDKNLLRIAEILKSNGTEGETLVSFREIAPEDIDTQEPVFIIFDGLPVPFFIENFNQRGNSRAIVKFYGIDTYEDAEELRGCEVFSADENLSDAYEDDLSFLIGWTLKDDKGNTVGQIVGYEDIPGNPCIYADCAATQENAQNEEPVLIPLHEDLIISVDEDNSILTMTIPDGLL